MYGLPHKLIIHLGLYASNKLVLNLDDRSDYGKSEGMVLKGKLLSVFIPNPGF
jgi:hypothetical protein